MMIFDSFHLYNRVVKKWIRISPTNIKFDRTNPVQVFGAVLDGWKTDNNRSVYLTSPVSRKAACVSLLQRAETESESVNTFCGGPASGPDASGSFPRNKQKRPSGALHLEILFTMLSYRAGEAF